MASTITSTASRKALTINKKKRVGTPKTHCNMTFHDVTDHQTVSSFAKSLLGPTRDRRSTLAIGSERSLQPLEAKLTMVPSELDYTLAMARSVFTPGKTFRMRLSRTALLTSSGGGDLQINSGVALTQMANASAVIALFTECRLHATRIHYVMSGAPHFTVGTPSAIAMVSAFSPSNIAAGGELFADTVKLPGAKLYSSVQTAGTLVNSWTTRTPRIWALSATTPTATDPPGGQYGSWNHCIAELTNATVTVATYIIETDYELRNPTA